MHGSVTGIEASGRRGEIGRFKVEMVENLSEER
jgi:hypothetical protein